MLTPEQQSAVDSKSRKILCIAGPGAGKTKTLTARIARVIRDGTKPNEICAVTFTNAAADSLVKRLRDESALEINEHLGYVGTLHSLLLRLIQRNAQSLGFRTGISVLDEELAESLVKKCATAQKYKGSHKRLMQEINLGPFVVRNSSPESLVAEHYYNKLHEGNMLDFDSLLHYGLRVVRTSGKLFEFMFVDEGQDNSDVDYKIYETMDVGNMFVVADVDQSIYGFRGGNPKNMITLSNSNGCEVIKLERNFRSDCEICDIAQQLIEHNKSRIPKTLIPNSENLGTVEVNRFNNELEEQKWVGMKLMEYNPTECAVLLRTNYLVKEFTTALAAMGVPVSESVRPEMPPDWKKAKALLALLSDPENDVHSENWIEHFSYGGRGPKVARAARLAAMGAGKSINQHCLFFPRITTAANLVPQLQKEGISPESVELVSKIIETVSKTASMSEVCLAVNDYIAEQRKNQSGVTVSTIHGAKGLEWENVFLPAFEEEVTPGVRRDMDLEEERRIAFVAVTRTKHNLHLSWCLSRTPQFGSDTTRNPSRFLQEMGMKHD